MFPSLLGSIGGLTYSSLVAYYPLIQDVLNKSGAGALTTSCLSTRYPLLDNGTIGTVAPNTAALTGSGVLIEGEGVNYAASNGLDLSNLPHDDVGQVTYLGNGFNSVIPAAGSGLHRFQVPVNFTNGVPVTLSFVVEAAGYDYLSISSPYGGGNIEARISTKEIVSNINPAYPARMYEKGGMTFIEYTITPTSTVTATFNIHTVPTTGLGRNPTYTADGISGCNIGYLQAEYGTSRSSYILPNGSPTTRNAVTATVPTSDVFVDPNAQFATNSNTDGYVNGVANAPADDLYVRVNSGTGDDAKYSVPTVTTLDLLGVIVTDRATGRSGKVTQEFGSSYILVAPLNCTRDELRDVINSTNKNVTVDFSSSAYDLAGATALRESVGDVGTVDVSYEGTVTVDGARYGLNKNQGWSGGALKDGVTIKSVTVERSTGFSQIRVYRDAGLFSVSDPAFNLTLFGLEYVMTPSAGADYALYHAIGDNYALAAQMEAELGNFISIHSYNDWNHWPTDNFRLSFTADIEPDSGTIQRMFDTTLDGSNQFNVRTQGDGRVNLTCVSGGVDLMSSDVIGTSPPYHITVVGSTTGDTYFEVNGVRNDLSSLPSPVVWFRNTARLGGRWVDGLNPANGIYSNLKVEAI